ncbi:MAG: hemerythrin [Deltaproteobacteria bacterium RBG_13_52_11]|nr:MAG: hemerythrin [Deltaproteobacteria bacterium RBG_13_52_11]
MALITWDQSFSVYVEFIDKQHQMLVHMINDLYDAMLTGKEKDAIGKLIDRLYTYAAMHFSQEEHYFDLFGYPETDNHKKEHNDFEQKVSAFEADFKEGRQSLSKDIIRFLSDWLVEHIKRSDKKYGPFLNERGVK